MRAHLAAASLVALLVTAACAKSTPSTTDQSTGTTATSTVASSTTNSAGSAAKASAADTAAVRKYIADADARWQAAENSGDANAVSKFYSDSAITMYEDQPTNMGREAVTKSLAAEFARSKPSGVTFHTDNLMVSGDLAIETGTEKSMVTPPSGGKRVAHTGRYMTVWHREPDGTWKVVRDMDATTSPAPAKPAGSTS
jgi:ketosteroid isomerase-like protein